jgi:hypothetical protein
VPDEPLTCITNTMPDVRSCVVQGAHTADCDRGDTCTGCRPREAARGLLCGSCWFDLEHAVEEWAAFYRILGGEDRAMQPELDSARKPQLGPRVPISPMQIDIDAVLRLQPHGLLTMVVATSEGAMTAVRFTRAATDAIRRYPTAPGAKKITKNRCPACGLRTLVYEPAQHAGDDATVRCLSHSCGNIMDSTTFERVALIEAQCCRRCREAVDRDGCTNTACTCHTFAPVPEWERTRKASEIQPFDPRRPDHAGFDPLTLLILHDLRVMALSLNIPKYKSMRKPELVAAVRKATDA